MKFLSNQRMGVGLKVYRFFLVSFLSLFGRIGILWTEVCFCGLVFFLFLLQTGSICYPSRLVWVCVLIAGIQVLSHILYFIWISCIFIYSRIFLKNSKAGSRL